MDMITPSDHNKPKQISRLRLLLDWVRKYTPEDERKFLDLKYLPEEGLANIEARNKFLKKTLLVAKHAVLAINKDFLPRLNDVERRKRDKVNLKKQIEGKKAKPYKEKNTYRFEVGKLMSMLETVASEEGKERQSSKLTSHFSRISKPGSEKK